MTSGQETEDEGPDQGPCTECTFHAKGQGVSMEGFRKSMTCILEQIILAAPLRTDYREAAKEKGKEPSRG